VKKVVEMTHFRDDGCRDIAMVVGDRGRLDDQDLELCFREFKRVVRA